jgi:hypothetical protein
VDKQEGRTRMERGGGGGISTDFLPFVVIISVL